MDLSQLRALVDNKALLSLLSAAGGALVGNLVAVYSSRIRVIEYTVNHERLALSAEDTLFGTVGVTWQGVPVTNLYVSTVQIQNDTATDYTNLEFKVWTGTTLLLTERAEIPGTTYLPTFTETFAHAVHVEPGDTPTEAQFTMIRHNREYRIHVLNRGQRVLFRYLTTVPVGADGPSVWVDMLHPGVRIAFRPMVPEFQGVAVKLALPLGLLACLVLVGLVSVFVRQVWAAAVVCTFAELTVQVIGAWLYRGFKFLKHIIPR